MKAAEHEKFLAWRLAIARGFTLRRRRNQR